MNATLEPLTSRLRSAYCSGRPLALFFDFDGTLTPIVDHPRLVRLDAPVRDALRRLGDLPRVHPGVVSGRQLSELRELVGLAGLLLAGTSGLELDFRGVSVTHPGVGNLLPHLDEVAHRLRRDLERCPGAWVEQKRVGLTVHFRHVAGAHVDEVRAIARRIQAEHRDRWSVVAGPCALEITPNVGWTKGTAIRMFLRNLPGERPLALYAGDSANDAEALRTVRHAGGVTIGVGADAPEVAEVRVAETEQLGEWLCRLAPALQRAAAALPGDLPKEHCTW